jgi:hypothetical protein
MLTIIAAAALAQAAPAAAPAQPVTIIHAGTLLDVPGRAPRRNASILVQGRKILEVRDGFAQLPGARIVDLRTSTVMPGFIDSHVHLEGLDDRLQARLLETTRNSEDEGVHRPDQCAENPRCRVHYRSRSRWNPDHPSCPQGRDQLGRICRTEHPDCGTAGVRFGRARRSGQWRKSRLGGDRSPASVERRLQRRRRLPPRHPRADP